MARKISLNDLQAVLLAAAAQREDCSLIPLPKACKDNLPAVSAAIASLVRRKRIEQRLVEDGGLTWRREGAKKVGLFITRIGIVAIGAHEPQEGGTCEKLEIPDRVTAINAQIEEDVKPESKIARVVTLLKREDGATPGELMQTTGWLPHTTRAAITGLRKKGHEVEHSRRDKWPATA